jgi:hypothetical protein
MLDDFQDVLFDLPSTSGESTRLKIDILGYLGLVAISL